MITIIILLLCGVSLFANDFVHSHNGKIVIGELNKAITLRGINFSNYSDDLADTADEEGWYIWNQNIYNEDSFKEIATNLNMNTVRLNLDYRIFEKEGDPYNYLSKGWLWLDEKISWAKDNNIYLILDMHTPQGGYQSWDFTGEFWGSSANATENKARLIALWKEIARRYSSEITIAGFDIINEALPSSSSDYFTLIQEITDSIRTVDKNHLIIVEEAFVDGFQWQTLTDSNYAIDVHFYETWNYITQSDISSPILYPSSVINASILEGDLLDQGLQFALDNHIPLNIGEYGVQSFLTNNPSVTGVNNYLKDMHTLFEKYSLSSQLWNYRYGVWGIYSNSMDALPDTTARNKLLYSFFSDSLTSAIKEMDYANSKTTEFSITNQNRLYFNKVIHGSVKLRVYTLNGQELYNRSKLNTTFFNLPSSKLGKGIYLISIILNNSELLSNYRWFNR